MLNERLFFSLQNCVQITICLGRGTYRCSLRINSDDVENNENHMIPCRICTSSTVILHEGPTDQNE